MMGISLRAIFISLLMLCTPLSFIGSSESIETDSQILWLRVPGDGTLHYISIDGSLRIIDQYDGSLISEVDIGKSSEIMREGLPAWSGKLLVGDISGDYDWSHIDGLEEQDSCPGDWSKYASSKYCSPSIIVNGDYSANGDFLFLNICKVELLLTSSFTPPEMAHRPKLLKCEFLDFNSEYNVTRNSTSFSEYAVTYPTENGTFRVFSNHTVEDPISGKIGSPSTNHFTIVGLDGVPRTTWGYGNEYEAKSILPYPLKDGKTWVTSSFCAGGTVHHTYSFQEFHRMSSDNSSLIFSSDGAYRLECEEQPKFLFAGDGCWMTIGGVDKNANTIGTDSITRWSDDERESAEYPSSGVDNGYGNISTIPLDWFHIRLPMSSTPYERITEEYGWVSSPSEELMVWTNSLSTPMGYPGSDFVERACSVQYGRGGYNQDSTFGSTKEEVRKGTYDIDHQSCENTSKCVTYYVECDWRVRKEWLGTIIPGNGCNEIQTYPEEVYGLSWHREGIGYEDEDFGVYLIWFCLLIFGVFLMLDDARERRINFEETGFRETNEERRRRERKKREREKEKKERRRKERELEKERTRNFEETGFRETNKQRASRIRRKDNAEKWKVRQPELRAIAEKVFSGIESFSVDLDDGFGCLHVTDDDYNDFHYDNVLSRSIKSVKKEMKKDRDRERQSYSKPRSGGTGLIDYLHAATNIRCTHCDQPTEGGPYPGTYLCAPCGFMFDSYGNTI